jgi:hypothetical protein
VARHRPDLDTEPRDRGPAGRATAYIDAAISAWLADFDLTRIVGRCQLVPSGPPHPLARSLAAMRSRRHGHRLAALERDGLIARVPDPADGRGCWSS